MTFQIALGSAGLGSAASRILLGIKVKDIERVLSHFLQTVQK